MVIWGVSPCIDLRVAPGRPVYLFATTSPSWFICEPRFSEAIPRRSFFMLKVSSFRLILEYCFVIGTKEKAYYVPAIFSRDIA